MKKAIITAIIMACAAALHGSPQIKWLSTHYNYGAFSEDKGPVSCEFKYVNTGDEPLMILGARASCGCTQPIFDRKALAPGDTAKIKVTYNPAGRPGRFNKSVTVDTNTPEGRSKLSISGVVIGAAASVAGRYPVDKGSLQLRSPVVLFGKVLKPHLKTVFAEAYNMSADSLEMRVLSKPKFIDINFEPKTVGPGEQVSIICYLRSSDNELWGLTEDSVRIAAGKDTFALPFTAIIEEDFSKMSAEAREKAAAARIVPDKLDFGRIERRGEALTMEAELHNDGKSTLEIRKISTCDKGVEVSIDKTSVKKGKKAVIRVCVRPQEVSGDMLNARISIITNDPEHQTLTLRAVGEIF